MGKEYDHVISFNQLKSGLRKSRCGVMWKDSVASYSLNSLENVYRLRKALLKGSYRILPYKRFTIHEPKDRDILATGIRDRTFQRSLCDNSLYPMATKSFIRANCACLRGRGADDAHRQMMIALQHHYRSMGNVVGGYALKCDIKGFFPNTPHITAQQTLCSLLPDPEIKARACEIIESFAAPKIEDALKELGVERKLARRLSYSITLLRMDRVRQRILHPGMPDDQEKVIAEVERLLLPVLSCTDHDLHDLAVKLGIGLISGIGLGSQCSQITELAVLNPLDHFIKERLRIKGYVRYMDDFVLIHESKAYLQMCLAEIRLYVERLGLTLNAKTQIIKVKQGIIFLHWRFLLSDTGAVIMKADSGKAVAEKRKLRGQKRLLEEGRLTMETIEDSFRSWRANMARGDTKGLIYELERYYKTIFGKEPPPWKKKRRSMSSPSPSASSASKASAVSFSTSSPMCSRLPLKQQPPPEMLKPPLLLPAPSATDCLPILTARC